MTRALFHEPFHDQFRRRPSEVVALGRSVHEQLKVGAQPTCFDAVHTEVVPLGGCQNGRCKVGHEQHGRVGLRFCGEEHAGDDASASTGFSDGFQFISEDEFGCRVADHGRQFDQRLFERTCTLCSTRFGEDVKRLHLADASAGGGNWQPHMAKDAGVGHALQQGGFTTGIGARQQRQGLLVALDGGLAQTVGDGVGFETQQDVSAFLQPHAVTDQLRHHAAVMVSPAGDGQPLIGFDEATHGHLTVGFEGPELTSEVHKMVGLLSLEFGFERSIDAVDGLPVNFRRPSVGENVKRTAQPCWFKKSSEVFTGLLHGFLNDVACGITEFSLKRRAVGQCFEQFSTRECHLGIVHGVLHLLVDIAFELFDRAPQLVFDTGHLLDGRRITEHGHGFW